MIEALLYRVLGYSYVNRGLSVGIDFDMGKSTDYVSVEGGT